MTNAEFSKLVDASHHYAVVRPVKASRRNTGMWARLYRHCDKTSLVTNNLQLARDFVYNPRFWDYYEVGP